MSARVERQKDVRGDINESMIAEIFVTFYRFWHGRMKLKGAGFLISKLASVIHGLHSYKLRLPEGHFVVLDFRDMSALWWVNTILGDSNDEMGLISALSTYIRPESIVWDVGANCGIFSYLLAKVSRLQEAHFFEPNPQMFNIACSALAPFPCTGHNFALSESSKRASFVIPAGSSTVATLEPERRNLQGNTITIECKIADELVASGVLSPPSVIKIDTEGHEVSVLKGMAQIMSLYHPVVFFEHLSLSDSEVANCVPPNYALYSVRDQDGTLKAGFNRSEGHNSVLLPLQPSVANSNQDTEKSYVPLIAVRKSGLTTNASFDSDDEYKSC